MGMAQAGERSSAPVEQHLPNGLRVVVQSNDHTATVVMSALVRVTALHEPRDATGIRQLTGMLVARGDCCNELLSEAAIRSDASVAPDYVELVIAAPTESLHECARALRKTLFRPQFGERALEMARDRLVRGLAGREEVPTGLALRRLYEQIYPGIGAADNNAADPAEIATITLADVRDFHAQHFLPNATVVSVSGGIDAEEACDALAENLRGLLPGSMADTRPEPRPEDTQTVEVEIGGPTSVLAIGGRGVPLSSPDYPAMAVGMTVLGSGMDSRLYRALRVEESLAYTIVTELTPGSTAPSGFALVTCDPGSIDRVQEIVAREIAELTAEPVDHRDLQRAKRYLIGRQALRRQRNREIAHYAGVFELLGGVQGYRRDAQLAGEIGSVGGLDVMYAMRRLFDPAWTVRVVARNN